MNSSFSIDQILRIKKATKEKFVVEQALTNKTSLLSLLSLADKQVERSIAEGLVSLGINVVIWGSGDYSDLRNVRVMPRVPTHLFAAFDFFVFDWEDASFEVVKLLSNGVVPIMPKDSSFSSLLEGFDPMRFSGNSFIYAKSDLYNIFARIVAYTENNRFPEDRKILLKNVCQSV